MLFERIRREKNPLFHKTESKILSNFPKLFNFIYILADNSIKVIPTLKMKSLTIAGIELGP